MELGSYYLTLETEFSELLKEIPSRNFITLVSLFCNDPT